MSMVRLACATLGPACISAARVAITSSPSTCTATSLRAKQHWLEVRTRGTRSNRDGCGARITEATQGGTQVKQVLRGVKADRQITVNEPKV